MPTTSNRDAAVSCWKCSQQTITTSFPFLFDLNLSKIRVKKFNFNQFVQATFSDLFCLRFALQSMLRSWTRKQRRDLFGQCVSTKTREQT